MTKKLLGFQDVLKEELKDKEFRKYYEEEGRKLENQVKSPSPLILSPESPKIASQGYSSTRARENL